MNQIGGGHLNNSQWVTKAICNKGFSSNSSILPRSNFGVGGQESSPQFLTAYSLDRWVQASKTRKKRIEIILTKFLKKWEYILNT